MKKNIFLTMLFAAATLFAFTACSDSDDSNDGGSGSENTDAANIDVTTQNVQKWAAYMHIVAQKLVDDSRTLLNDWTVSYNGGESYANIFKAHNGASGFNSSLDCIGQIIDGCADIANEVGSAKIGDPYDLYIAGKTTEALYAVESWYSWHSIDDYSNNIISVQNAYYGARKPENAEINSNYAVDNSIYAFVNSKNAGLAQRVDQAIKNAYNAIQNIPAPFRNNIASQQTVAAMDACADLEEVLSKELKPFFTNLSDLTDTDEAWLDLIVNAYVDDVVVPTYTDLVAKNQAMLVAVQLFRTNPTDANLENCANAWMTARAPWETSEAFLFGPVADKGLDPNMDSWPLDQDGIVKIMNSGDYSALDWTGEYDEDSESIADAQSLRGYHTLEFLIFKNGKARTIVAVAE